MGAVFVDVGSGVTITGPRREPLLSGKKRGVSVWKVSQVSEAEPGDASSGLMRSEASENPICPQKISSKAGDMYIIEDVKLILGSSSPCKPR